MFGFSMNSTDPSIFVLIIVRKDGLVELYFYSLLFNGLRCEFVLMLVGPWKYSLQLKFKRRLRIL